MSEAALQRIDLADRNLSRMESDWRGLQGLLRQIEGLRESARLLELDVSEPDDSLRQVRVILAQPALDVGALDHAAELAAEALMRLHDSLPLALEEFLDRLSSQVTSWPPAFEGRRHGTDLDREAHKLLRANRLVEATQRATELQQLIFATGVLPAPEAAAEPAPAPGGPGVRPTDRTGASSSSRADRPAGFRLWATNDPFGPRPGLFAPWGCSDCNARSPRKGRDASLGYRPEP